MHNPKSEILGCDSTFNLNQRSRMVRFLSDTDVIRTQAKLELTTITARDPVWPPIINLHMIHRFSKRQETTSHITSSKEVRQGTLLDFSRFLLVGDNTLGFSLGTGNRPHRETE